ncbi:MAG TPA: YdcF family protein [Verrucomicrobiae bacterium]|nr:YdcF family protein [Verrucomicrobiae bacterium]
MIAIKRLLTRKRCLLGLWAAAALGLVLVLAGVAFPHQILSVDSGPVTADALVVLGGGSYERPIRAAELFHEHVAARVIVTGTGDCETNRRLLIQKGVPEDSILVEPNATSTRENALFTSPLLRRIGAQRVILVTSWYHSRRSLKCFGHYAPDLQFYSRPAYFAYARSEWSRQGIYRYIRGEYIKLAGYWVLYGVCPF